MKSDVSDMCNIPSLDKLFYIFYGYVIFDLKKYITHSITTDQR